MKSENTQAVTPFDFEGSKIRVVSENDDLWFVAKDICDVLKIANVPDALLKLDDEEKMTIGLTDSHSGKRGGAQSYGVVSESGMYTLVLRSRGAVKKGSPAHRFRKWVTSEVLPTIRKTGRYEIPQSPYLTPEQRAAIKAAVASRVATLPKAQQKGGYPQLYSAMNGRFGAPKYEFIRAEHFDAAMAFIGSYYFPALESTFNPEERAVNAARGAHEKGASRYLVAFNEDGRIRQVRPVEDGATVVSPTIESVYTYLREDLPYEAIPAALQMIAMRASNRMYYGAKGAPMPEWARSA